MLSVVEFANQSLTDVTPGILAPAEGGSPITAVGMDVTTICTITNIL